MERDLDFSQAAALDTPVQKPALKAPWHLFLIGSAAVLWNALGLFGFLATLTQFPPYMAQFPEESRIYWANVPMWTFAIWGVAVLSALVGSMLLLRRQVHAVRMLALSATATMFSMAATYSQPGAQADQNRAIAVFVIVVALLLLNYAFHMSKRGVLR
jgi:hypothetical protein